MNYSSVLLIQSCLMRICNKLIDLFVPCNRFYINCVPASGGGICHVCENNKTINICNNIMNAAVNYHKYLRRFSVTVPHQNTCIRGIKTGIEFVTIFNELIVSSSSLRSFDCSW